MTAKTKTSRAAKGRPPSGSRRRNRNNIWLALLGVGLVALIALFVALQSSGDGGSSSSSRFTSIYTFETADLHALSFDPSNLERLVFGHHGGVMASEDGGKTWKALVDRQNFDGMNLVFDPAEPSVLYLAGHNVFSRSSDGGRTWESVRSDLPGLDLHGFGASTRTPGRFYAFAGGEGLFVSEGGTSSWTPVWLDAPPGTHSIVETDDGLLLLGAADAGILRSDDEGKTWTDSRSGISTGVIFTVKTDNAATRIYAGTTNGVYVSSDAGRSWQPTSLDDTIIVSIGVNPIEGDEIMAISRDGQLYHSTDGGITWSGS